MKAYLYETFHRCESLTDWALTLCSLALSSTQKIEGKYSIKMTANDNQSSGMTYLKTVDWSEFEDIVFWVYHSGWTNEKGQIFLYTDVDNYSIWEFDFAASWTERTIDLSSEPDSSAGTLDLSNITYVIATQINPTTPGEDYYFDFFHGRSIDISADIIHPLSFIECPIRDYHRAEIIAKGTWLSSRDYTLEILDYLTSNGSSVADQIIFEGSIIDYELTSTRKIWCDSRAKNDLDEFRPSGDYNGDLDSNHIKTLIAECFYITEGTIDATVGNTDNTFKGDKTFRTILNDWADKHYKHWYLSPTGALTFNDADVDSGVILFHHKATYNFKDEAVSISGTDIGFVDTATLYDGACEIVASWQGHRKVLRLQDDATAAEDPQISHNETQATSGTREFYIGTNDITKTWNIAFREGTTVIIELAIQVSKLEYRDDLFAWQTIIVPVNDTIYHLRVTWRADNTMDIYLNGTKEVDNVAMTRDQVSGIDNFKVQAFGDSEDYFYIDAYGDPDNDIDYNIGDNLKGQLFHCWNVKPKKHVDAINWVMLLGAIVDGVQIPAESKDQASIDQLGAKIYKDTYALIKVVAQLQIAADNLRTREQLLPLAINLWSYEANRGLIQVGECVWVAHDKGNPNISPRQVIINKIKYRFLSGHTDLQTTDGIAFFKDKGEALPQENSLLIQQNAEEIINHFPIGSILMYSGAWVDNTTILGWYKCDGNNGTINLVDKFVRGGATSGATGGSDDAVVVSHAHNLQEGISTGAYSFLDPTAVIDDKLSSDSGADVQSTGVSGTNKNIPAYDTLIFIQRIS